MEQGVPQVQLPPLSQHCSLSSQLFRHIISPQVPLALCVSECQHPGTAAGSHKPTLALSISVSCDCHTFNPLKIGLGLGGAEPEQTTLGRNDLLAVTVWAVCLGGFPQARNNAYLHLSKENGSKCLFSGVCPSSAASREVLGVDIPPEGGTEGWAGAGSFEMQRPSRARPLLVPRRYRPRLCCGMPGVPASILGPPAAGLAAGAKPFLFRLRVGSRSGLFCRRPRSSPTAGRDARGSPRDRVSPELTRPQQE